MYKILLGDICTKESSNIRQSDLENHNGDYPIYGASGLIKNVDFYIQDKPYIGIVKDGAGVGRVMKLPAYSSVIGTMQYIIPNEDIDVSYLAYAMEHMNLSKYYMGAAIPHIYFKDYKHEPLTLHTKKEQKTIVSVLDTISSLISNKECQTQKLDELVKSRFVEMFGDPVINSMNWLTVPLATACSSIVDCPHLTPKYTDVDTGYMCIRTSIIKKNEIRWNEVEFISEDEYYERIKRKKPQKGDIIYTREGAILGIAAIINKECNVALGQRSMLLSPNTEICLPEFLCFAMNFESFFNSVTQGTSGSASPHINVADIKKFSIIIPQIELQSKFADFVTQVENQKATVQQSIDKLETLKKSLMQEYFG